jgi:tetratricopeptide (TPR) repeat protein
MRIFLSYSSNDRELSKRIHLSLVAQQHDVFFDREDLTPGLEYDNRIAQEIQRTDLYIFLISPDSVSHGRYTLNELGMIQRRWAHPSGRVLPVMARPTAMSEIPAYLKAVTILQPAGDIPAEVSDHVRRMKLPRPKWLRWAIGGIAGAGLVVALWGVSGMSTHVRAASDFLQNARSLQEAGEYASAFENILAARTHVVQSPIIPLFQHQLVQDITIQQLTIVTSWLDDMRVKEGEHFFELVSKLLPTLDEAITTSAGAQKATLLAYRGWADFLRSRDSGQRLKPETFYQQALDIDPTNVHAHTMWGHWITWTRGNFDDAKKHFDSALTTGQQRPYVRDRQLSAMANLRNDEGDGESIRIVSDMLIQKEPIPDAAKWRARSIFTSSCGFLSRNETARLVKVLPESTLIILLRNLFPPGSDREQTHWIQPCIARLQEHAGQNAEALQTYRTIQSSYKPNDQYWTFANDAIKRLSTTSSKPK